MNSAIWLWVVAIAFGLIETGYFGWNWTPQSPAEMACDGITLVLFGIGTLARLLERRT